MTKEEMINAVGPCSLLCYTCFGYVDGGLREHAFRLHELYKGWYEGHVNVYSKNLTKERIEKLRRITIFNEMLEELYSQPGCTGCQRNGGEHGGCIAGCKIPQCAREHSVNFCGECGEFPCQRDIPEKVRQKWLEGNTAIRERGLESYFEENKHIAHYIDLYKEAGQ